MDFKLKNEILEIIQALRDSKKLRLAECIEKNWQKTCLAYSKELNTHKPTRPIEKELLEAFEIELTRVSINPSESVKILDSIQKRRILQTGPHVGVTESPRMLCINWLGSLGVLPEEYYIVAMFSGIPFSNRSRPGRINQKTETINLFPSSLQDALVYKSTIQKKLIESVAKLSEQIKKLLPKAQIDNSYTKWALLGCQSIERKILNKNNLLYLDANEIVSGYLQKVLEKPEHIFYKIFFDPKIRAEFTKVFGEEIMFYSSSLDGKYETTETFSFTNNRLKSKSREISLENPKILIQELKDGKLCPGLIASFLTLAFLNQFKCFGSFAQVEYLPVYQKKLMNIDFMQEFDVGEIPTSNLTTGTFPDNFNLYPADIINQGIDFNPNENMLFGEILIPMKQVILESYFTGDSRKK